MSQHVIGVDIGGTSMKYGLVDSDGNLLWKEKAYMENFTDGRSAIHALCDMIAGSLESGNVKLDGIGVGCAGSIDSVHGVVDYSNNLGWKDVPIKKMMEEYFHVPVRVSNDANVACLGESDYGAAKGLMNVVMLTLGTGVGSGFVFNGHIYDGKDGKGAEFGHSVLVAGGRECTCGRRGCVEAYCSGTALLKRTREEIKLHPESKLASIKDLGGKEIFSAARSGDVVGVKVAEEYFYYLKEAILNLINTFRPDVILISGGISHEGNYLTDKLNQMIEAEHYGFGGGPKVEIKIATLGNEAGIIGAACLILDDDRDE